jgi:hypothetical protein
MADFVPQSDAEFDAWQGNFVSYASANLTALGLTAADLAPITAGQTAWAGTFAAHTTAQASAQAAREAKDAARTTFVTEVRALVRRLQASPAVSDEERLALGINVRSERTPATVPTSRPIASVAVNDRLRHTVSFTDESTPASKARPSGVMGCEVWVKVGGTPPADPSELHFLGLDTRTPYVAEFDGADAGKPAHYVLRWVNKQGESGPWSATVTATIPG